MTLPRPVCIALYVASRPWTVWVVAIGVVITNRAGGAAGFDAVALAIGPALLWMGFSWLCRVMMRFTGDPFARSILPSNKALPTPQLAVIVTPDEALIACSTPPGMAEQLPADLKRLIEPVGIED